MRSPAPRFVVFMHLPLSLVAEAFLPPEDGRLDLDAVGNSRALRPRPVGADAEAEANLRQPEEFPAPSWAESGRTVEDHEALVSAPADRHSPDRVPLPAPAGKPEPEPGREAGPRPRAGREPEEAAVERLRQIVSTERDAPDHGAMGRATPAEPPGPGLAKGAAGMPGNASGGVGADSSDGKARDRAEDPDVGAGATGGDGNGSAPVPPAPESKEGLYLRALDEAKGLKVLSANVLQRRLQLGRNGVLEILQRMLDEGAIDEDDLDSRTFVELVRRQA